MLNRFVYMGLAASMLWGGKAWADVNIAVIAPQAGESQIFGEELISGVKMAVDGINAQGGLRGEKIPVSSEVKGTAFSPSVSATVRWLRRARKTERAVGTGGELTLLNYPYLRPPFLAF